jgi:Cof subfamily protein (haloacid dehalogenase superfamily)
MKNIVLDLDGTLLRSDKSISDVTVEYLLKLNNCGIRIIIATARPPRSVYNYIPDELSYYEIIFYNGALVHKERKTQYEKFIDKETVGIMFNVLRKYSDNITFGFESNDWLYTNGSFEKHWDKCFNSILDFDGIELSDAAKILIDLPNTEVLKYVQDNLPNKLRLMVTDRGTLGQVMEMDVSKYNALKYIINDEREIISDTICFGDDLNDIDLFNKCENTVAVSNATIEIKNIAKYITLSNDEDGIFHFLKSYYKI